MDKDTKTETILIRVTPDLKKRLQIMADKDNRALSDFVRLQLENLTKGKK